jgi:Centrosome microtubule-binding domain of Cep57
MGGYESDNTRSSSTTRNVLNELHKYKASKASTKASSPNNFVDALSDFSDNNDMIHSTRQQFRDDSLPLPLKSSPAHAFGHDLSQIDEDNITDDSLDIEFGRGGSRLAKNTPSRPSRQMGTSDIMMDLINNPSLNTTPQSGSKQKKIATTERSGLRREVLNRRVPSRQADEHDKENTPITSRVSSSKPSNQQQLFHSLPRGTPRANANSTRDSFAIPDVTGITDIVGMNDTTPITSRHTRPQSRHISLSNRQYLHNFHPVVGVPLPEDEKHLIRQLELLSDKMAKLERENIDLQQRIHEYDEEVFQLRIQLDTAKNARRTDSALGSSDDEGSRSSRTKLQIENTRLDAIVKRLQTEVQEKEREIKILQRTIEHRKDTRSQGGVEDGDVVKKLVALERENIQLRESIDDLNRMLEELHGQLDDTRDHHDDKTQEWTQKEMDLHRRVADAEGAIAENQDLRQQLANAKAEYDREVHRIRKEADSRRAAEEAAKFRYAKLQTENEKLQTELLSVRTRREKNSRAFSKAQPGDVAGQEHINIELQQYNEELRTEIERLKLEATLDGRRRADAILTNQSKRSRSTSKSRSSKTAAAKSSNRHANVNDDVSENESTTDISEALMAQSAPRSRPTRPSTNKNAEPDTELSNLTLEEQRNIRRRMERERFNQGHRRVASAAEVRPSLSRKSSLKSINGRSKAEMGDIADNISVHSFRSRVNDNTDNEFMTGANQDTQQSRRSSINIRRKSGNMVQEMTSGFILPDFTLPAAKLLNPKVEGASNVTATPHSPNRCTVCYRLVHPSAPGANIKIPVPVPVSTQIEDDIDATSRPSESPRHALYRVIKQVADEIAHLKLELHAVERRINAHDGSRGSRERQALHEQLDSVNRALSNKNSQLYSLYDALEGLKGQKRNATSNHEDDDEDIELTRDATEDVKEIISELKASRRVTIQSPPNQEKRSTVNGWNSEEEYESDEDEAPWEGLSVTTGSMGLGTRS